MNAHSPTTERSPRSLFLTAPMACFLIALIAAGVNGDESSRDGRDVAGTIIIKTSDQLVDPPVFFKADARTETNVGVDAITQAIELSVKVIQGKAETISLGLVGDDQVTSVTGEHIRSWAIRQDGEARFLDLQLKENVAEATAMIKTKSPQLILPGKVELTHLAAGDAVGFNSVISIQYDVGVEGVVTKATHFSPLGAQPRADRFQTATGGVLELLLNRDGAAPAAVELSETTLAGQLHANGDSFKFQLRSTAIVRESESEITILAGRAAVNEVVSNDRYRLRLASENGQSVYKLVFYETGTFPIALDFVAPLINQDANWRGIDFHVGAGAVVPVTLSGLDPELEFRQDQQSIVPIRKSEDWTGFLPATGRARLHWKSARKTGEGKLFFSTTARVESRVSAGLLRQDHQIDFKVLQGELREIVISLNGPGEILDVRGANVVAWKVTGEGNTRQLDVTLSQPIADQSALAIRSQTPLGAFPLQVEGLRLNPNGAIRHSGFLRLSNSGSVRIEPTSLGGLAQLAPDQFPGDKIQARQVFVYRFPAADHTFAIAADRIQPEVSVSQLVLYELAETDRIIRADIELDVREAPIRETDFTIPADYSVVSVTGASVADYVPASDTTDNRRNLKVIFSKDVSGRQLVSLHLEKSQPAVQDGGGNAAEVWQLPRIEYPEAKSVRGDIGVVGAPGFRLVAGARERLTERPLSYFPKPTANLQLAFRIREPAWSATMQIEPLEGSVQADVFHLYSLSQETVYGSALINYFVTGAPVSEWELKLPRELGNVLVDGKDVRTWRRTGDTLFVTLHQPVMGAYTLLVTFEEKPSASQGTFQAGLVSPVNVQGERGYVQVVSPTQVEISTQQISDDMLKLDALELPAEFRLLSSAPSLGAWQYTEPGFELDLKVNWFQPGTTAPQVVEFAEANSRVSQDGELVTDVTYYVKTRGRQTLKVRLPGDPVRLWAATVDGQPVTARQTDEATLIPLPGNIDPNNPIQVRLRLGKPSVKSSKPVLALPVVAAPVLKTNWHVQADEGRLLVPTSGTVEPATRVLPASGLMWLGRRGIPRLLVVGLLGCFGIWATRYNGMRLMAGLLSIAIAIGVCISTVSIAASAIEAPAPLELNLPILSPNEAVELTVNNWPQWRSQLSVLGLAMIVAGIAFVGWSCFIKAPTTEELSDEGETNTAASPDATQGDAEAAPTPSPSASTIDVTRYSLCIRCIGVLLVALGILMQQVGAPWFFGILGIVLLCLFVRPAWRAVSNLQAWFVGLVERRRLNKELKAADESKELPEGDAGGGTVTALLLVGLLLLSLADASRAEVPAGFEAANSITQQWKVTHEDARLTASGTATITGKPGDRFLLLKAPATLTRFEGEGLRLTKSELPGAGLAYIVTIPLAAELDPEDSTTSKESSGEGSSGEEFSESLVAERKAAEYQATFEFQLEALRPMQGIPVLTGPAAVQEIDFRYDQPGWEATCTTAVRLESVDEEAEATHVRVLLGPGAATLVVKPIARDLTSEETQFFVEASNLYLARPGVVDGRHRIHIRPSQGQVRELTVLIPTGLTVSAVDGPIDAWQFDAEQGRLEIEVEPHQSQAFHVMIETQRSLATLPVDLSLAPLKVANANGEVGFVAIAFGEDAQPEKSESETMSVVNLGDFDSSLIPDETAVLHRVYRYGADGGELSLRIAAVQPEVRVTSKQVLSLGDERVVLAVNFVAEISRAGLFKLSFPLPSGFEVESLTGDSLHHWSELTEGDQQQIILHLNGKTIGPQRFSLTMAGAAPQESADTGVTNKPVQWTVPRLELNEATRQMGDLIVRPTTGIRLSTDSEQNVSETDPRAIGGKAQGSLAFRLLQKDWTLVLNIEKLDSWITGQVLHEITLREGQTRSAIMATFDIRNASVRQLQVKLPITNEDEIKTVRASGNTVSDIVRSATNPTVWNVQLKRRVVGRIQLRVEYERRGDRSDQGEMFAPAEFADARQLSYHFAIRAGGRLEVQHGELAAGWQRVDWNTVPQVLREAEDRTPPAIVLKAVVPQNPVTILAKRHSLADALKLRVAEGMLTTVLSPSGDQLTAVDLTMEVIQRSSLQVGLPAGGELFSIFVNGESVNSVRQDSLAWQFYVLPGIDDRTAKVRFVYSVAADRLSRVKLYSPQLNVPLENIEWKVIAPEGFQLNDHDGNLELVRETIEGAYDRDSYLSKLSGKRQVQAQQAAQLLEQANRLLQAGEQTKARWAFNSVANQYALDAASNEDARVQLENLQTQQAIVGLNTRRQRLFIDNAKDASVLDNQQLREAAAVNPILQQDQLNFRPQELSQLLRGNTSEDNAVLQRIAGRLVQHQRTTEPAPQAILISLPEEGKVYTFARSVQVAENAPLELDLRFGSERDTPIWRSLFAICLIGGIAWSLSTARFQFQVSE